MEGEPVRVAVFFATQAEHRLVERVLSEVFPEERVTYAGVAEGWILPQRVGELLEQGLAIDLVDERFPAPLSPRGVGAMAEIRDVLKDEARFAVLEGGKGGIVVGDRHAEAVDPRIHHHRGYDPTPDPADALHSDVYFIRLGGPITRRQRRELERLKVDIGAFLPPDRYRTFLTRDQYAQVRELPYVREVVRYGLDEVVTRELEQVIEALRERAADDPPPVMTFDCMLHRERDLPKVRALIEATEGTHVTGNSNLRVRFEGPASLPLLGALAALPEVRKLWPYESPTLQ